MGLAWLGREGAKFTSATLLLEKAAERANVSQEAAANLLHVVRPSHTPATAPLFLSLSLSPWVGTHGSLTPTPTLALTLAE